MRGHKRIDDTEIQKSTRITASLADDEYARLSVLAEEYDVSLSWLTRRAVVEFLKRRTNSRKSLHLPVGDSKGDSEE